MNTTPSTSELLSGLQTALTWMQTHQRHNQVPSTGPLASDITKIQDLIKRSRGPKLTQGPEEKTLRPFVVFGHNTQTDADAWWVEMATTKDKALSQASDTLEAEGNQDVNVIGPYEPKQLTSMQATCERLSAEFHNASITLKTVERAYPSSTRAIEEGYGKAGCWVVLTRQEGSATPETLHSSHRTRSKAFDAAADIKGSWCPYLLAVEEKALADQNPSEVIPIRRGDNTAWKVVTEGESNSQILVHWFESDAQAQNTRLAAARLIQIDQTESEQVAADTEEPAVTPSTRLSA